MGEAAAELYSADPEEFVERRAALVARARAEGDAPAAKQIAGLRKPTRSAWVVNQLARSDSGVAAQLVALGDELRAAQASLDGTRMRELSVRRRKLIEELTQHAFAAAGQHAPPAALRDEVTSTLGAALADPGVAEQLQAGTLHRPVRPDGFGSGSSPALTLVWSKPSARAASPARSTPAGRAAPARKKGLAQAGHAATAEAKADAEARAKADAEAKAEADRARREQAIADAEARAAETGLALEAAADDEMARQRDVELLETQLADAQQRLQEARLQARRARNAERAARQALGRLQK